jgi:hypothetical protein
MIGGDSVISIFGSAQAPAGSLAYEEAQLAGTLLAHAGVTICTGGYGGLMEAVSRGAKLAGAKVIGVTARSFGDMPANPWVDTEIRTVTFLERLRTMIELGRGYLALKGGIGTLTEISTVWSLLQTRSLPLRPLVLLTDPWQELYGFCAARLIIRPEDMRYLHLALTPDEAVRTLVEALQMETT